MKKANLILTLLVLVIVQTTMAETYYASPSGNDVNPGTETHPWLTIQHAVNMARTGDVIYVKAGVYKEQVFLQHYSGTADHPIVLTAYPGDEGQVIIDGTGIRIDRAHTGLISLLEVDHIEVRGFVMQNSNSQGMLVAYCRNIKIENNVTINTYSSGIGVWNSASILVHNNEIDRACMGFEVVTVPIQDTVRIQECLTISGTTDFEVSYNSIHGNNVDIQGGEGLDIKDACQNGLVHHNEVYNNNHNLGIYVDGFSSTCQNIRVYNNIVYNTTFGIAIGAEEGGTTQQVDVFNNILFDNKYMGIIVTRCCGIPGLKKDINIFNNTINSNGMDEVWGGGIWVADTLEANIQHVDIRNNIVSHNATWQIGVDRQHPTLTIDNNLVYPFPGLYGIELQGTNAIELDPLFTDQQNLDFHLQSNSPAIDAGSPTVTESFDYDGHLRPHDGDGDGSAIVDLGAYEYGAPVSAIPTITSNLLDLRAYPNPIQKRGWVEYELKTRDKISIYLHDLGGHLLHKIMENEGRFPGKHREDLYLPESLSAGSFLLSVQTKSDTKTIFLVSVYPED